MPRRGGSSSAGAESKQTSTRQQKITFAKNSAPADTSLDESNMADSETEGNTCSTPIKVSTDIDKLDEILKRLDTSEHYITSQLQGMKDDVTGVRSELNEKIDSIKYDVDRHDERLGNLEKEIIPTLIEKIHNLEKEQMRKEIHSRKRNLLFYGIPVNGQPELENTAKVLTNFMGEKLGVALDKFDIVAVHRLRRPEGKTEGPGKEGPPGIIAVFARNNTRDTILANSNKLKNTRITIRTDLPVIMKKARRVLAQEAYCLRKQDNMFTRIRVIDTKVMLEARSKSGGDWDKVKVIETVKSPIQLSLNTQM